MAGFSFEWDQASGELEVGSTVRDTTVQIGDCTMQGELLIMHTTDDGEDSVRGALFYPATDADLVKLKSLLVGLELSS